MTYALGGGLIGAAGFYSFTQPLAVRVAKTDAARAITRLTIWGAFSSPIMIPFTEILRANFGWQIAVRLPAALTAIAFLVAAAMCRVDVVAGEKLSSSLFKSLRGALSDVRLRLFAAAAFFFISRGQHSACLSSADDDVGWRLGWHGGVVCKSAWTNATRRSNSATCSNQSLHGI